MSQMLRNRFSIFSWLLQFNNLLQLYLSLNYQPPSLENVYNPNPGLKSCCGLLHRLLTVIYCQRKRRVKAERLLRLSMPECPLDPLPSTSAAAAAAASTSRLGPVTEYNPNYDFTDAKSSLQDLREIPREKIVLIRSATSYALHIITE